MAAEDQVKLDVRTLLRQVVAQEAVYETNRRGVRVAARELDQAIEFSERPEGGGGAGNQGLNISRALDNILDAQDELIESWVDYETARLGLFRDLGTMYVDEKGSTGVTNLSDCNVAGCSCSIVQSSTTPSLGEVILSIPVPSTDYTG